MIAVDISDICYRNIFIMPSIKNTLIQEGLFYKLLYSNDLFTLNGIYIKLDLNDTNIGRDNIIYNVNTNMHIINRILDIEKYILNNINSYKKKYYKIYEQIKQGNLRINTENNLNIIIKISGIWENTNSLGISYKIISNNNKLIL